MKLLNLIKSLIPKPQRELTNSSTIKNGITPMQIDTSFYKNKRAPSEAQLKYASKLGINVTPEMTSQDVSAIISRITDEEFGNPSMELILYAQSLGREPSPYVNDICCIGEIIRKIKSSELCSFYAYAVDCSLMSIEIGDPRKSKNYEKYKEIGNQLASEDDILKSIENRPNQDFLKPNKNAKAYKRTIELLQSNAK